MANLTFNAGRLRHRVDLQRRVETQNQTTGEVTYTWETFAANVACEVSPLSVKEFIASAALQSEVDTKIILRYRTDVVAKSRALQTVDGIVTAYNIAGVLRDPKTGLEWMTLPCQSGVNDG